MAKSTKFIFVSGGVLSGNGKGIATASIGFFFSKNYKVVPIKLDGYLNTDPGTMNPIEHGEVFVLNDGHEVDMDFGHYERFIGGTMTKNQSITMGKIFQKIIEKERNGDYLGDDVQMIPHVTDLIQDEIMSIAKQKNADIVLVEIGGTIGDIESDLFIEALRQMKLKLKPEDAAHVHLTYVPIPYGVKEQKTKPTQQSVNLLNTKGMFPDFILGRCREVLEKKVKEKIALFANIPSDKVFTAVDVDSIYKIPGNFYSESIIKSIAKKLNLNKISTEKMEVWNKLISKKKTKKVTIAIAGKYTSLEDSYASVVEALNHSSAHFGADLNIKWIDTDKTISNETFDGIDGVIVPGGFGKRGIEGKIKFIEFARKNKIPYLGICLGLQLAVIEFLRNECGINDATSLEFDEKAKNPVITILDEQKDIVKKGGTMRLGSYDAILKNSGNIRKLYEKLNLFRKENDNTVICERHRHRYEVNPDYVDLFVKKGLIISGYSKERQLVEFIELDKNQHPYFVGTQAHPELKSKLEKPAPLFYGLIEAALKRKEIEFSK
jgi:CTP synthase